MMKTRPAAPSSVPRRRTHPAPRLFRLGLLLWCFGSGLPLNAARWKPFTEEDLAPGQPQVDPGAGVEALLREIVIDDSMPDTEYEHYIRLKVFNQRGVDALDRVDIYDLPENPVRSVAARVIKPDGSIIEVEDRAIYSRDVIRYGSLRMRVKSFSFPALEPGCLVDYQWRVSSSDGIGGQQLYFQSQFPCRYVHYQFRPFGFDDSQYRLEVLTHFYKLGELKPDRGGFYHFELHDMPATSEEAFMPPRDVVEPWLRFYFSLKDETVEEFWQRYGRVIDGLVRQETRPDRGIRELAKKLTADVAEPRARLERVYEFCRTEITNLALPDSGYTPEQREKLKENKRAADTLAHGYGTRWDINTLFVALADQLGLDARLVPVAERSDRFFNEKITSYTMLPRFVAAVRLNEQWEFFDPGAKYVPLGSLEWENEGVPALIADPKKPWFEVTPQSARNDSLLERAATAAIDAEGTLSADVTLNYGGHLGVAKKRIFAGETGERIAEIIGDEVHEQMPQAVLSAVRVEHAADGALPVTVAYHLEVPGYAERTSSRLFVQPSIFQKGAKPIFAAPSREFGIYFPFPWVQRDVIRLTLPPGYAPEEGTTPRALPRGTPVDYRVSLVRSPEGDLLGYQRIFGVSGMFYPPEQYQELKNAFEEVHAQDNHVVVVRRRDDVAATGAEEGQR